MTNETLYQNVVSRLYHEDSLLSQRTTFFLTTHAFLVTGLSVMVSSKNVSNPFIVILMPIFGIFLAFFHFAISSRNMRSIEFFRAYISLIEKNVQVKVDTALYEFYKSGIVVTEYGIVGKKETKESNLSDTFPWNTRFLNSSLQIIAIWLPFTIGIFWSIAASILTSLNYLFIFPGLYLLLTIIRIFQLGHFFPSKPIALSNTSFNLNDLIMPLPELIDRLIIAEIKQAKSNNDECENERKRYAHIYKYYQESGIHVDGEIYKSLKEINMNIWDLESDIRKGAEKILSSEEIADRTLRIRDLNKKRIEMKNNIATKYKFPKEIKLDHASA